MASIFTQIIEGDLPGHFIWKDDLAVAILTIAPIKEGHVLVIPRAEIDHWDDLPDEINAHLMAVSKKVTKAIKAVYDPLRVGLVIAGLEVPHTHLHLLPVDALSDFDFSKANMVDPASLAPVADKLKTALIDAGHSEANC